MLSQTLALESKQQILQKSLKRAPRFPSLGTLGIRAVFLPPSGTPQSPDSEDDPLLPPRVEESWFDRTRDIRAYNPITGLDMESPEELNERLRPTGLARHRLVLKPDEQFGSIVRYEAVVEDTLPFHRDAWLLVAKEEGGLAPPDDFDVRRAMTMPAELAVQRVMHWTRDWGESRRLAFRKGEAFAEVWRTGQHTVRDGMLGWFARLRAAGIPMCLCSDMDQPSLEAALDQLGIRDVFEHLVTAEDGFDTRAQMFLQAAIKLGRPPQLCAVFDHDPEGISAAHDISARCVAVLGLHTAWELQSADLTVPALDDLTTYNIRRLFSSVGDAPMDALMPELEPQAQRSRWRRGGYEDPDDPYVYASR